MIPKHTVVNNRHHYFTELDVYFVMSRMTPAEYANRDGCESSAPPCHDVYNTFLMKLRLDKRFAQTSFPTKAKAPGLFGSVPGNGSSRGSSK